MRSTNTILVVAFVLAGCVTTRYVYVPAPQQGQTVAAANLQSQPDLSFDHTRRADLDRNCVSIGAPPYGYRVLGDPSHTAARTAGCRPGLNMFNRPDPDIYCCQMLPEAGAGYATAPGGGIGVGPGVAGGTPNLSMLPRDRRSDLDGNCLSISAPPYGYRVMGAQNHALAQQLGCREGLNMFRNPDPDVYCCPDRDDNATTRGMPPGGVNGVVVAPGGGGGTVGGMGSRVARRSDVDANCLSIGAPPQGWIVEGVAQHSNAQRMGCREGLNSFRAPDPDIYCCPPAIDQSMLVVPSGGLGIAVAPSVGSAPFTRVRRADLDGNCRSIGAPPLGWMVEGDGNHRMAEQSGCRVGLNRFRQPDPDIYCCGF